MQQETIGEACREDFAGSWDEDPREEKTGSHRWTTFALAGGGRPKPEMTTAIHDVVSLPQCIVNSGPRASLDWVSSQNLAGPACRELVGADQKQRSIVFVKPPGVSFRRNLAAIQARRVGTSSAGVVRPRNRMILDPEARRVDTSLPNISWVVFHFVFLPEVQILVLERVTGMVRDLILNVLNHPVLLRDAHGERTESVLPSKLSELFACVINVLTGVAFQCSHKIRDSQLCWDANK
jgi:hypothetical protein